VKIGDPKTKWAEPWMLPFGVLPRMRLAACGWTKPGDAFKAFDDAAWWSAPFEMRAPFSLPAVSVWTALATYAATVEVNAKDVTWILTQALFDGDSSSISTELANIADDLSAISVKQKGAAASPAECAPYVAIARAGAQPIINPACITKVNDRAGPLRPVVDFNDQLKGIALFILVGYILSKLPDR
jgi:hypothetical protein